GWSCAVGEGNPGCSLAKLARPGATVLRSLRDCSGSKPYPEQSRTPHPEAFRISLYFTGGGVLNSPSCWEPSTMTKYHPRGTVVPRATYMPPSRRELLRSFTTTFEGAW